MHIILVRSPLFQDVLSSTGLFVQMSCDLLKGTVEQICCSGILSGRSVSRFAKCILFVALGKMFIESTGKIWSSV